jgi:hypothetical protein
MEFDHPVKRETVSVSAAPDFYPFNVFNLEELYISSSEWNIWRPRKEGQVNVIYPKRVKILNISY